VPGVLVTAIGDSVMLGAAYDLAAVVSGLDLDAQVGRQGAAAVAIVRERAATGTLGSVLLIHIGNNGLLTRSDIDEIVALAGPERRVVFVNLRLPRDWQNPLNAVIAGAAAYPNAVVVDWHAASANGDGLFANDGVHLTHRCRLLRVPHLPAQLVEQPSL
jgi:hypothetical protein